MKTKSSFYFVLLFLVMEACPASPQEIFFNKVLPPEGKIFSHVSGIVQDKHGYMWLATKKGLFKYDGYQMTSYNHNPDDSNSLATDFLEAICIDSSGIIWIAAQKQGLERFDPVTGIFTHFTHDPNNPASLSVDWVSAVLVDHEGVLWVGGENGLDRFDAQTGKFFNYRNQSNDPTSISCDVVVAIYEDKQNTLWIGTGSVYAGNEDEGGLNRMDKKTGKFTRYVHDPRNPHSLINNKVRSIFEDSKGNFWVGTAGDGLHTMDRLNGTFQRHLYDPAHPEKLSRPSFKKKPYNDYITFIIEDVTGAIWIGTAQSGLNYYNPDTKKIKHYELEKDTVGAFTARTAWWAYRSMDGVIWISTLWDEGNLYRINPHRKSIPYYESIDGSVNSIYEEADGNLWRGTEKGLQLQSNRAENEVRRFANDPGNPGSLSNNSVQVIKKDRQGNIWVGTQDGLNLLDKNKGTFIRYRHDTKNINSLSDNWILDVYEDRQSDLWIGTTKGLNRMNRKTNSIQRYIFHPADTGTLFINVVSAILEDKHGGIWVGCQMVGDIHLLNPANGNIKTYLKGKGIYCFCEDAVGTFWAGGDEGVFQYSRANDRFIPFSDSSTHTEFSFVRSIGEDEQHNLWVGSSKGISQLNKQRIVTRVYGKSYGINGTDLRERAFYKGNNGKLFFGTYSGYFVFFPDQLAKDLKPPQIVFSDFRLTRNRIQIVKNNLLPVSPSQAKTIRLQHNQNTFSFEFAAIDYNSPEDNRHFFMLENYNDDWVKAGSERKASYYNVPPGKYVFRVKAANSNGIWAERKIDIIIMPPWWRRGWAYCIYGLLLAAVVFAIYRFQKRRILMAERQRNQKRELAHAKEIEKAYAELKATQAQLIQSEKMASLGELTAGIAHEIQNPLNFVNNFSEVNSELLVEMKEEIDKGNLDEVKGIADDVIENQQKINHHGRRADAIVKGMLQHSRISKGQKEPTDINALADEYLRLSYHGLRAKDKEFNAEIKTDFDNSIGKINVIPQDIGRVLLNLYNNAFYAVNEKSKEQKDGYESAVYVNTKKDGDKVLISVKDNGNGIPQKVLDKIFQPFFTTKATGQGTGLGLSLAYDIIKAHGGEIKVETKEGEGSVFIIQLT